MQLEFNFCNTFGEEGFKGVKKSFQKDVYLSIKVAPHPYAPFTPPLPFSRLTCPPQTTVSTLRKLIADSFNIGCDHIMIYIEEGDRFIPLLNERFGLVNEQYWRGQQISIFNFAEMIKAVGS